MDADPPPTFSVRITAEAELDLEAIGDYITLGSPANAVRFIKRVRGAIDRLGLWPRRFPTAREADDLGRVEVRRALVDQYRIIFEVRDKMVTVLHIRHAARGPFTGEK